MGTFTLKVSELIDEDFDFGLTDYPIFDSDYRENLNKKILDHYWNYEIGQETESMFRFSLNRKMREVMPYYNQLYKSTQIEFDPLQTMNYQDLSNSTDARTGEAVSTGTNTSESTESGIGDTTSTTGGKSRSVSSTTPQVQLSGNEDYASSAADVNSTSDVVGHSTNSGTSNVSADNSNNMSTNDSGTGTIDRTLKGSQGSASDLLTRYRETFLNIDMQVIRELESLFMQIWDNGDEFSGSHSTLNWGFGYGIGFL